MSFKPPKETEKVVKKWQKQEKIGVNLVKLRGHPEEFEGVIQPDGVHVSKKYIEPGPKYVPYGLSSPQDEFLVLQRSVLQGILTCTAQVPK